MSEWPPRPEPGDEEFQQAAGLYAEARGYYGTSRFDDLCEQARLCVEQGNALRRRSEAGGLAGVLLDGLGAGGASLPALLAAGLDLR